MSAPFNWTMRFCCEECTEGTVVAEGPGFATEQEAEDALAEVGHVGPEWIKRHAGHTASVVMTVVEVERVPE